MTPVNPGTDLDGLDVGVDEREEGGGARHPHPDGGDEGVGRLTQLLYGDVDESLEDSLTLDQGLRHTQVPGKQQH